MFRFFKTGTISFMHTRKSKSTSSKKPKHQRILLKLSGEALSGKQRFGIDENVLPTIAAEIKELWELKVQVAIVIGGGNIFRGLQASPKGRAPAYPDYIGMLATTINSL